jgi:hypothetical protein
MLPPAQQWRQHSRRTAVVPRMARQMHLLLHSYVSMRHLAADSCDVQFSPESRCWDQCVVISGYSIIVI